MISMSCKRIRTCKTKMPVSIVGKIAFEAPFWGLGATYAVHLRLIGKLVGDSLLVIIELFFRWVLSFCHNTRV